MMIERSPSGRWRINKGSTWSLLAATMLLEHLEASTDYVHGQMLDVGCERKPFEPLFRDRVERHWGVDLPRPGKRIDVGASLAALPFPGDTFDTVLCTEVIEHVPTPQAAIAEINRVLRPGGHLVLSAPQTYWLHEDPLDFFRFTRFGLEQLLISADFKILRVYTKGGTVMFTFDFLSKLLLLQLSSAYAVKQAVLGGGAVGESRLARILVATPQMVGLALHRLGLWIASTAPIKAARSRCHPLALRWKRRTELFTLGHVVVARKEPPSDESHNGGQSPSSI